MKNNLELLHDRYARALFTAAQEAGTVEAVMEELSALNEEWLTNKEFKKFLKHRLITSDEKKKVIEALTRKNKYSRTITDFLKVLIDNHREGLIHGVFLAYNDIYNQYKKRTIVYAEVPRNFSKDEKSSLIANLKQKLKEDVKIEFKENPDLLGGVFIKCGDRIYDYSVRGQLDNLERILVK